MAEVLAKKDVDILEERGYWKASSSLHAQIKRLVKKRLPLEIGHVKSAHGLLFVGTMQESIGGRYRRHNCPELRRIDGTRLRLAEWTQIPHLMAQLNDEVVASTKDTSHPRTNKQLERLILVAARLSHRLAAIHPFENGNGRASRLLLSGILLRAGLPEIAVKQVKPAYLRAMRQADEGDYEPLKRIIIGGLKEVMKRRQNILRHQRRKAVAR